MNLIFTVFVLLGSSPSFSESEILWRNCESNSDCVIARGSCGAVTAVSVKHRDEFEKSVSTTECDAAVNFEGLHKDFKAECIENKCRACRASGSKGKCLAP